MNYTLESLTVSVPLEEYLSDCVDVEKFLGFCRQCPNYNKIWACTPFAFDPMEIWGAYRTLTLHARVLRPEPGTAMPALMEAFRTEKIRLSRWVLDLEREVPGSLSMAASTCIACTPCARAEGKPCRHPQQVRYSIEALGGDVSLTMEKYLHTPLCWIREGLLTDWMSVV